VHLQSQIYLAAICASLIMPADNAQAAPTISTSAPLKKAPPSAVAAPPAKKVTVTVPAKKAVIKKELPDLPEETAAEAQEAAPVSKKSRNSATPNEDPTTEYEGSGIFTHETAHTLFVEAKQHMRRNDYNRALRLLTKAIKLDDDDMEVRVLYAEALDEKLQHQAEKDPEVFNKCIKSWLMVARNEIGDEKGMTFKGLGILSGQYGDEDWVLKAKKRLKVLTGYSPKPWETNDRYLRKVLRSADTSVSAVIKSGAADDEPVKIVKPKAKQDQ